ILYIAHHDHRLQNKRSGRSVLSYAASGAMGRYFYTANIYSNKFIAQKITYIHDNPVRAGLVEKPEEYVYSSAKAYAGDGCVLDVSVLTLPWITY
ncbi:MAG: hypothetical protein ACLFUC_07530, partial [Bacteroidales bacterium]